MYIYILCKVQCVLLMCFSTSMTLWFINSPAGYKPKQLAGGFPKVMGDPQKPLLFFQY